MKYGVPYTGSKNGIAKWVIDNLPRAKNFVDVFAGGCAVTHAALLSGKYENFVANDLSSAPQLFLDAIHGKYRDEKRWISREDFFRLKESDAYVKYCFSFGNNGTNYAYGNSEKAKEALHYAIVWDDWKRLKQIEPDLVDECKRAVNGVTDMTERRHKICLLMKRARVQTLECLQSLQSLERLQSLQSLQSLESLERLTITNSDYRRVFIPEDTVIYCDPPYKGTDCRYGHRIDYEEFYAWCKRQTELVIVSEYDMPKDDFVCVAKTEKRILSSQNKTIDRKEEGLYVPRAQEGLYWRMMEDEPTNEFYERMSAK